MRKKFALRGVWLSNPSITDMSRQVSISLLLVFLLAPAHGQQPSQKPTWPTQTAPPAQTQQPPPLEADDIVRITTNLVQIDTVVTRDNKQVTDLTAQDFEIFEDGKPQTI